MFLESVTINKNVVQVSNAKVIEIFLQSFVNKQLKYIESIAEPERYNNIFK